MIGKELESVSAAERNEVNKLMKTIAPHYNVPGHSPFLEKLIEEKYFTILNV